MTDQKLTQILANRYRPVLLKYTNFIDGNKDSIVTKEEMTILQALKVIFADIKN